MARRSPKGRMQHAPAQNINARREASAEPSWRGVLPTLRGFAKHSLRPAFHHWDREMCRIRQGIWHHVASALPHPCARALTCLHISGACPGAHRMAVSSQRHGKTTRSGRSSHGDVRRRLPRDGRCRWCTSEQLVLVPQGLDLLTEELHLGLHLCVSWS